MPPQKASMYRDMPECKICLKVCKSERGLTQHYFANHLDIPSSASTSSLASGIPGVITSLSSHNLQVRGIPEDITMIPTASESNNQDESPNAYANSYISLEISSVSSEDSEYNMSEDDDSSIASDSFQVNENITKFPDIIREDDVLPHYQAGYIYQIEGIKSGNFDIQRSLHIKYGHPFYPWATEDEFWLADFIYIKAKMSRSISDSLLKEVRSGRVKIRDANLSDYTSKQLANQLDKAPFITVCIWYS